MRKMTLVALAAMVVIGCYGPANPPPDPSPNPTFTVRQVGLESSAPVDGVDCPVGSIAVGGGCDCAACPLTGDALFACVPTTDNRGWVAACYGGCVSVYAQCMSTSTPGTLREALQQPSEKSPELKAAIHQYSVQLEDLKGTQP